MSVGTSNFQFNPQTPASLSAAGPLRPIPSRINSSQYKAILETLGNSSTSHAANTVSSSSSSQLSSASSTAHTTPSPSIYSAEPAHSNSIHSPGAPSPTGSDETPPPNPLPSTAHQEIPSRAGREQALCRAREMLIIVNRRLRLENGSFSQRNLSQGNQIIDLQRRLMAILEENIKMRRMIASASSVSPQTTSSGQPHQEAPVPLPDISLASSHTSSYGPERHIASPSNQSHS